MYTGSEIFDHVHVPDIYQAVINLGGSLDGWLFFLGALAYLFSLFLMINVLLRLARQGAESGFMSNNRRETFGGIAITFFVAVALFHLPSVLESLSFTVFNGQGSAFSYTAPDYYPSQKIIGALAVIYKFIGICGVLAVIMGFLDWHRVGAGLTRHGWGKGAWHIIGGWAALHLDDIIQMLKFSAGIT